ncbi:N-acetylglucosamine-6-phosphate deacetylase [Holdemania massiliensis]|uniref:N-acetylglucosamine-6-phosphate deacetylase n=1 Tax=Holdemania massiliensis TaxID=1468449 RepID=UPI0036F2E4E2
MIIYSERVCLPDGIRPAYLIEENGRIKAVAGKEAGLKADVDYGNQRIIPGIIDTHNHGAAGYRFDDANEEELKQLLKAQAAHGVTAILPTTTIVSQFPILAKLAEETLDGARIAGIHSEGPWGARVGEKGINTGYPPVDLDHAKKMIEEAHGKLVLVDIAPEVPGALEAIDYFVSQGVTVAAYHTNANYAEANRGIDHGITVATHLGNVMTGLHHRDIGTMGACILRDEVDCELICDGLHVCLPMIQLIMKMKDHDRIMLVSDNGAFLGAPVGYYKGGKKNENSDRAVLEVTPEGFVLSQTGRLTGSSMPVLYGIGNLVEKLHMPLEEVVRMSSANPARKYNLKNKGELAVDKDLDLVVIDEDYNVVATYVEGRKVFDRAVEKSPFNESFLQEYKIN